jgi:3D (Asp-Asp-Asp) domain-containing protein
VGRIVAAPPDIRFETVLDVPGYGRAVVADRGGAIQGRRLDVLFPTHSQARAWGVRFLAVRFNAEDASPRSPRSLR